MIILQYKKEYNFFIRLFFIALLSDSQLLKCMLRLKKAKQKIYKLTQDLII
jgi:hypothetical protein